MIALRVHGDPDAFPAGDLGIQRALGKDAEERSTAWRPWRAYAVMALWKGTSPATLETRRHRSRTWKREARTP